MLTLTEILIAMTLMIVLSSIVLIVLNSFTNVSNQIYAQYQGFSQALPSLTIPKQLLRSEIEPYPAVYSTNPTYFVPTPGFGIDATPGKAGANIISGIGNYGLTFYTDIADPAEISGVAPAMIVAQEYDSAGNPVADVTGAGATTCTIKAPCTFQVREFVPTPHTCPYNATSPQIYASATLVCQYPANYKLISNVTHVINGPYTTSGLDVSPIFSYVVYDPTNSYTIPLTATQVRTGAIPFTAAAEPKYTAAGVNSASLFACASTAATNAATQSMAVMCPADAIQRVSIDLQVEYKTSGTNGATEVATTAYRNLGGNASTVGYPFQFSGSVG